MDTVSPAWTVSPPQNGQQRLTIQGTLNVFSAGQFFEAARTLSDPGAETVVVCDDADYLDASALQILLALKLDLQEKGQRLRLTGVKPEMKQLIRLAGLTDHLATEDQTTTGPIHGP